MSSAEWPIKPACSREEATGFSRWSVRTVHGCGAMYLIFFFFSAPLHENIAFLASRSSVPGTLEVPDGAEGGCVVGTLTALGHGTLPWLVVEKDAVRAVVD